MSNDEKGESPQLKMVRAFVAFVPHNKALGLEILDAGPGWVTFRLPYDERLVGDPETGVLHGGAVSALLDACCGSAVFAALPEPQPVATLDLRIDYLGPAEPRRDVLARADCYKLTHHIAFVRAVAHQGDVTAPIASAVGTFMRGTRFSAKS